MNVLVDDHPIVRDGLRTVLHSSPEFRVVAEAAAFQKALDKFQQSQPVSPQSD